MAPAGVALERLDALRQLLVVLVLGHELRALEEHVRVVVRPALHQPEHLRVVLGLVVERSERHGTDALDEPQVEVLVRDEPEEVEVGLLLLEDERARLARRRVEVLEPAAAARVEVENEDVLLVGQRVAEDRGARLDDLSEVGLQSLGVVVALSPDGDLVRLSERLELEDLDRSRLDGRIDEPVVVGRDERVRAERSARDGDAASLEPGRDLPVRRRDEREPHGEVLVAVRVDEEVRSVEVGVRVVEVARADGEIVRVDAIGRLDRSRAGSRQPHAPCVLVDLLPPRGLSVRGGREVLNVARELAHQIGAGRPDRHHEVDRLAIAGDVREARGDREQVGRRLGHRDGVADVDRRLRARARGAGREGEEEERE